MKLFIPMLALVWLAAIAMVSMGHRGQGEGRGRGQSTYAMKTYVRQLQGCLRDVRQQNKILEDKNRILEVEIETYKTKNEKLQEEIDELEEISQCCVRYNGVCHEEGIPFNTTDGCNTCTCTSSSMNCVPVPGACLEGCTYQGTNHTVGTLFPYADHACGWCTCKADGTGMYVCMLNEACTATEETTTTQSSETTTYGTPTPA